MMYNVIVWIIFIIFVINGYGMFNYNIIVICSVILDLCLIGVFKIDDL